MLKMSPIKFGHNSQNETQVCKKGFMHFIYLANNPIGNMNHLSVSLFGYLA